MIPISESKSTLYKKIIRAARERVQDEEMVSLIQEFDRLEQAERKPFACNTFIGENECSLCGQPKRNHAGITI